MLCFGANEKYISLVNCACSFTVIGFRSAANNCLAISAATKTNGEYVKDNSDSYDIFSKKQVVGLNSNQASAS